MTNSQRERLTDSIMAAVNKGALEAIVHALVEAVLMLLECSEHVGERTKKIQQDVAEIKAIVAKEQSYREGQREGRKEGATWVVTVLKLAGVAAGSSAATIGISKALGA